MHMITPPRLARSYGCVVNLGVGSGVSFTRTVTEAAWKQRRTGQPGLVQAPVLT